MIAGLRCDNRARAPLEKGDKSREEKVGMTWDAVELLLSSELLRGVSEAQLRAMAPPPEWLAMRAGETLIRQGEPGEAFYLLVHGRLRVFVDDGGRARRVGEVVPGEGVGEMSLLTDDLTSATVRVMHDSSLVRFSRESYLQLMGSCPEAALQVMRTVIKRLRHGIAPPRQARFTRIAVVPLDRTIDTAGFTARLARQIAAFQPARVLGPDDLGPELAALTRRPERPAPAHEHAINAMLLQRERSHDGVVLYQALPAAVEWSRIAIRQADLVLLLAEVRGEPELRPVEQAFIASLEADLAPRMDLVLLHPSILRKHCHTSSWLAPRKISEWHHVRADQDADMARLARALTGNAICLVLGGGGARGLAQIGVLRALKEAGVPIDRVGGTSMGSLIAALAALGQSVERITHTQRLVWHRHRPLSDYTFPALSIVRGRRLHNLTRDTFANQQIEDLPIPYYCVSCSLTDASQVVHDRGPLWQGVRASASLPGTGPPLFLDGHILVDGGVINNLPVDIMRERHGGFVIAVEVGGQGASMQVAPDIDQTPSGWHILWHRINPFLRALSVPSIFEILYRTATLNAQRWSNVTRALADLVIEPPVSHIRTLDFKPFDAIVEAGYRDTLRALHATTDPRLARYLDRAALPDPDAPLAPGTIPAAAVHLADHHLRIRNARTTQCGRRSARQKLADPHCV
jgi:NTE family protein/lysophospholipid hydrolase